jgi:hypothetical protein
VSEPTIKPDQSSDPLDISIVCLYYLLWPIKYSSRKFYAMIKFLLMNFSFLHNLQPLPPQLQVMFLVVRQSVDHLLDCLRLFVEIEVRRTHCISQLFMCTLSISLKMLPCSCQSLDIPFNSKISLISYFNLYQIRQRTKMSGLHCRVKRTKMLAECTLEKIALALAPQSLLALAPQSLLRSRLR